MMSALGSSFGRISMSIFSIFTLMLVVITSIFINFNFYFTVMNNMKVVVLGSGFGGVEVASEI